MNHHTIIITILKFFFLFSVGTFLGWTIEVFWRKFFGLARRWINPGFLSGPWLPLYGFGVTILYLLCELPLPLPLKALTFLVVLTLMEYLAGIVFTTYFKIRLWDYSDQWGNLQGLICPLYSVLWMILGMIFYLFIFPLLQRDISILLDNMEFSFFVGVYAGLFSMDLWQSFNLAARIMKIVAESEEKWSVDYERFKLELRDRIDKGKKMRPHFLLPFYGEMGSSLREHIGKHRQNQNHRRLHPIKALKKRKEAKSNK